MKRVIYIDMDGTIADFHGAVPYDCKHGELVPESLEKGFYRNLRPIDGAKEAIQMLVDNGYDVYIASKPKFENPYCLEEKMEWVREHFPYLAKKVLFVPNKELLRGMVLIDDDLRWSKFNGEFIHFNHKRDNWLDLAKHLIAKYGNYILKENLSFLD